MSETGMKKIRIVNVSLSDEELRKAFNSLLRYSRHFFLGNNVIHHPVLYSCSKRVFNPDASCTVSEYQSFLNAVDFYLGSYRTGVKIEEVGA